MPFQPDYCNIVDAANNKRPVRLPLYEHIINVGFIEKAQGNPFADLQTGDDADLREFFRRFCGFFKEMTYDTVSFEVCITEILPEGGALLGERPGPIQNRKDFENYPWDKLPELYWHTAAKQFETLGESLPDGMKAIGGVGNGVFEISEDLVGFERLCYMQADDPGLFAELYQRIGEMMVEIWTEFLKRYSRYFAVCRFGDDLGFRTSTLIQPQMIISHIIPQYKRVIDLVHNTKLPFLLHSCGNIFDVMEPIIDAGIDAKHSNEDAIAPFEKWIDDYGGRIGLFGGIDVDLLCRNSAQEVYEYVLGAAGRFRQKANGYALGSGNSIPDYVPVDGFLAMIQATRKLRDNETALA